MDIEEYELVFKCAGGERDLRTLLEELNRISPREEVTEFLTGTEMLVDLFVPSRRPDYDRSVFTDSDGLYLTMCKKRPREELYSVSYGVCYGGTCGEGAEFLFLKENGLWSLKEELGWYIH